MLWEFIKKLNRDGHTIILTTHYLEEAETLCSRVAMMKQGQIVALDTTANLLNTFAGKNLRVKLGDVILPNSIAPLMRSVDKGVFTLSLSDVAQVEFVLAELRAANLKVQDMQLIEADLEDVFLSLVGSNQAGKSQFSLVGAQ